MIFYITERAIKNGQFRYIYKKTLLEKTEGAIKNRQTRDIETLE